MMTTPQIRATPGDDSPVASVRALTQVGTHVAALLLPDRVTATGGRSCLSHQTRGPYLDARVACFGSPRVQRHAKIGIAADPCCRRHLLSVWFCCRRSFRPTREEGLSQGEHVRTGRRGPSSAMRSPHPASVPVPTPPPSTAGARRTSEDLARGRGKGHRSHWPISCRRNVFPIRARAASPEDDPRLNSTRMPEACDVTVGPSILGLESDASAVCQKVRVDGCRGSRDAARQARTSLACRSQSQSIRTLQVLQGPIQPDI